MEYNLIVEEKSKIIKNAIFLVTKYHSSQKRLDGLPFLVHSIAVAILLAQNGFTDEVIAAGFLHDILEDTICTEKEIKDLCGNKVLQIVKTVTKDQSIPEKEKWEEQKDLYIDTIRKGPVEAKAVCLADKIHNAQSLLEDHKKVGPRIFGKFVRSKNIKIASEKKVLAMLRENWNHHLLDVYEELIKEEEKLEG